jgi:hypothetical protein
MAHSDIGPPPPTAIALVVCDNVYQDRSGKRALIGLFNRIVASKFPARHGKLCVYISLTSLRPQTKCRLDVVDAATNEPILSMEGPIPGDNPTTICDMVFELGELTFPRPGLYFFRFWGGDQVIVQRPIEVLQRGEAKTGRPKSGN